MEFQKYILGDICNRLSSGKNIKASKVYSQGKFPVYGGNGLRGYTDESNFKGDCAIIGRQGAYCGNVRYFNGEGYMTEHAVVAQGKEFVDNYYLACLLSTMHLENLSGQSAQPGLAVGILAKQYVEIPSYRDQKRLADILSSLDAKIENNNKINAKLEEMAQALFKSWFIDFEPFKVGRDGSRPAFGSGNFVESELGMIPEGWKVGKLGDLIKTTSGGTPSRKIESFYEKGTICWVKSKELAGSFIIDTEEKITNEAVEKSSAKKLPEFSVLIAMYGATVGEYAIIDKEMTCNQAICALLPNDDIPYSFLYMLARNKKEDLINKAVGSAQQNISQVIVKDLDIVYDLSIIRRFHQIVKPIFNKILGIIKENRNLAQTRDTLLPKLMSGEIEL